MRKRVVYNVAGVLAFLMVFLLTGMPAARAADQTEIDKLRQEIDELNKRLDGVETKTLMDKINLGAELRTRFDWYKYKNTTTDEDDKVNGMPSTRVRLNLKADVNDDLKFTGRLSMYKLWGDTTFHDTYDEMCWSRIPTDTTVKIERAYVDYFFSPWDKLPMAITFGRLPTTDGLPTDLREDTPRKSTYPALSWDAETDGVALTFGLDKLTPLPASSFKLLYTKWVSDNEDAVYRSASGEGYVFPDTMPVYGAQFETGLPGALDGTIFIMNHLYVPNIRMRIDMVDELEDVTGGTVTDVESPESLGSINKSTAFIESRNFLGSWIDWFAGYSFMKNKTEDPYTVTIAGAQPQNIPVWNGAGYTMVPLLAYGTVQASTAFMSDEGNESHHANALYVGARLNIPLKVLNTPKLGVEYNQQSKYWFTMLNSASEDPLHKLDVRGSAWDFYYIQPINKYFMSRIGYTRVKQDYDPTVFGTPVEDKATITDWYLLLDVKF